MNEQFDVVVVGSGAGGLSTAVVAAHGGARVLVVEKASVCGGATAWSGGWMWTPRHRFAREAGVVEDVQAPKTYLRHRLGQNFDEAKVDAYLAGAPEMVDFFESRTALQFVPGPANADIYGQTPGAATGHRQIAPKPVRLTTLGDDVARLLRRQLYETSFLGMGIMAGPDLQAFLHATRSPKAFLHCATRVTRHLVDLVLHRRGQSLVNGTALIGRLLRSAIDAGVEIRVDTQATSLVTGSSGHVVGVRLDGPEDAYTVDATRGVVLATGGFSHDLDLRRELFPRTPTGREHWTLPPAGTATGDGLNLGMAVGGVLDRTPASPVAYCPVSLVRYRNGRQGVFPHILDRGKPGVIGVLANGRRFVNEADGYHDYGLAMVDAAPDEVCSWLVADARYLRYYPLGMAKPFPVPTFPYLRSGYLTRGRTLAELARSCGIDPEGLEKTVAEFNENARAGVDPEFGRGATAFNRGSGDPDNPWPNPSLAPLEEGPFYAVKVLPGSFGTFAGLRTDALSRVLTSEGSAVPGLYAVGVDQANVMGGHYPSGGINIGPAMTFGYLTGTALGAETGEVTP